MAQGLLYKEEMLEKILHYIWKFQQFDKRDLSTESGERLEIISPGKGNSDSGPDFLDAKIYIGVVAWHGHVEIHRKSSDWYAHGHQSDSAYDNVVLHVVWENDKPIVRSDGTAVPTLELKNITSQAILENIASLVEAKAPIPCAPQLNEVPTVIKRSMLDKALYQRMASKSELLYDLLRRNRGDWHETAYQLLAYNFGFKVNGATFLKLAQSIPLKVILKLAPTLAHLEAALFGAADLLPQDASQHDYIKNLCDEFIFLKNKWPELDTIINRVEWKFFRLRPANFPTIRISQFAKLLHTHSNIFDALLSIPTKSIHKAFAVRQSEYWQHHYGFGKKNLAKIAGLGKSSIDNILINTVVPLLVAYGKAKSTQDYIDRGTAILEFLPAEHNKITRMWEENNFKVKSAFDSQGAIELYSSFCAQKRCLSCDIGTQILKKNR